LPTINIASAVLETVSKQVVGQFLGFTFSENQQDLRPQFKKNMYDSIRKACANCSCTTCIKHPMTTKEGYSIDIQSLPPIPTTYGKIRLVILEGSKSFFPMLAHPTIRTLGNYAYVLPSQCIRHFLAKGNAPILFDITTACDVYMSPKDTPCRIAISSKIGSLQNNSSTPKHLPISFVEWKDDCKSSKSYKASKTGSIWAWTMTIFRNDKNLDSPIATFPVAIGLKSDIHHPLEEIVGQDIKNMANSKIDASIGTVGDVPPEKISFSAEMFVSLGNLPEQRSGNKLMAGNSWDAY
jgi:hypothetical protein